MDFDLRHFKNEKKSNIQKKHSRILLKDPKTTTTIATKMTTKT